MKHFSIILIFFHVLHHSPVASSVVDVLLIVLWWHIFHLVRDDGDEVDDGKVMKFFDSQQKFFSAITLSNFKILLLPTFYVFFYDETSENLLINFRMSLKIIDDKLWSHASMKATGPYSIII